jgi:hypothetical protein
MINLCLFKFVATTLKDLINYKLNLLLILLTKISLQIIFF